MDEVFKSEKENQYRFTCWRKIRQGEKDDLETILDICTEGITDIEHEAIDKLQRIASVVRRIIGVDDRH